MYKCVGCVQSSPLFTKALAVVWAFIPEQPGIPYLHVEHNGTDLGRCVTGRTYYDVDMHFVADTVFKNGF